jgi:DNA-binding transcriptional MerR regulator
MRQSLSYNCFVPDEPRYAIGELADLGGVSRRTIRYYVQENLLPPPFGVGRGNHYGRAHLDQLLRVKALQESGRTLDEIRSEIQPRGQRANVVDAAVEARLSRTLWRRLTLAPGIELHVSRDVRLPAPGKLAELTAWCRLNFATLTSDLD